ncbi:HNH endonuclease [Derxia lacustris]|uniref:HNH endonuclease n=1 Tax=Derxia lacustris TaxID=764842 RepID=UPI00111C1EEE|nr:HNH endonuclease [Derxia lacustris]
MASLDKRFALIANNGDVLFPYVKHQRETGRTGFALTIAGNQDRNGGGDYTHDITKVIRQVVFDGYAVRAKTQGKANRERDGSLGLGKDAVHKFYVAPEFEYLVKGSKYERVSKLPVQRKESASFESSKTGPSSAPASLDPLSEIVKLTPDDYREGLKANSGKISQRQRLMLAAHYAAPNRSLSMRQLALTATFDGLASASIEYSQLGRFIADDIGIGSPGSWIQFLAEMVSASATNAELRWVMREPLAEALEQLGWVEPSPYGFEANAALAELGAEPGFQELPETTRLALVNARIGQGGFRRRMLEIWGGRCAVTGCALPEVLVASHAKSWRHSSTEERLDEFNGLPLVATLDRLFDRGLIGFADDGALVKIEKVEWATLAELGITPSAKLRTVHARHIPYLQHHRDEHGLQRALA